MCFIIWHYTYITWLRGWHTKISAPRWHESPGVFCHQMPKAEGDITRQGFRVTEGLIFWYSRQRRHVIYVMWHLKKTIQIKWNTLLVGSLFRSIIPLLCLLCLATATLDFEPDLISMQNKNTRGWFNCYLCDITVSGGWHNCFLRVI